LDRSNGDLNTEFIALANHRKAIRSEIAESSRTFRRSQLAALTPALQSAQGRDGSQSPEAVVLLLSAVSRFLTTENSFDQDIGHTQVIKLVENAIREIEGERTASRAATTAGPSNPSARPLADLDKREDG
jgi:hypothetical protein